jgi:hypothetical protein
VSFGAIYLLSEVKIPPFVEFAPAEYRVTAKSGFERGHFQNYPAKLF